MTHHERAHHITRFLDAVYDEYDRASLLYDTLHSAHEAYAVILEELDEFWDQVRQQDARRSSALMRQELVQIAAMCLRAVLDLGYGTTPEDDDASPPLL